MHGDISRIHVRYLKLVDFKCVVRSMRCVVLESSNPQSSHSLADLLINMFALFNLTTCQQACSCEQRVVSQAESADRHLVSLCLDLFHECVDVWFIISTP